MERLSIPGSRISITRLGLGCGRLLGGREMNSSATLIEAALQAGIRHFDTAPAYGSEEVLGEVLAGSSEATIATKIGIPRRLASASSPRQYFGSVYRRSIRPLLARAPAVKAALLRAASSRERLDSPPLRRQLDRGEVLRELSESLRRLRRTSVDVYLLHEPEGIEITDEIGELFSSLRTQGVIGAFGLAYGGNGSADRPFGTITQCRYASDGGQESHAGVARIYHGVLRHRLPDAGAAQGKLQTSALIRTVLDSDPTCAVVFSASSHWQIANVAQRAP
jgi:aryl-alcohol dehydrogenase-like predicted oxidoreductase